ncbi:CDP-glycerol glycerophosphotransferase family protein [Thalassospira sp.]|uniref:CDP-glycerol glycerophosphotransferase family protein n=1 Tax=Thalassospira sp. TaxID=1912094 RepID=UPI003AA8138C
MNFLIKTISLFFFLTLPELKKKNRWSFSTHTNLFADNPKYLFLFLMKNDLPRKPEIAWITKSRKTYRYMKKEKYNVFHLFSFRGIWYTMTSSHWFVSGDSSDLAISLSKGVKIVSLWHGTPIKKIRENNTAKRKTTNFLCSHSKKIKIYFDKRIDHLISPSEYVTEHIFLKSFKLQKHQIHALGNPRLDNGINKCKKNKIIEKANKKILYAPTFRSYNPFFLRTRDFNFLNSNIEEKDNNVTLFIKPHPFSHPPLQYDTTNKIQVLDKDIDIYEIIQDFDILISDISSLIFDFMALNKGIIIFMPDAHKYVESERYLYTHNALLQSFIPCENIFELEDAILKLSKASNNKAMDYVRENMNRKYNSENTGNACEKIYYYFNGINDEL